MTQVEARKLMGMRLLGYLIIIDNHHYEDQPVIDMREAVEEDVDDKIAFGEIVYDSSVFTARPMSEVSPDSVKTYIPFDWQNSEVSDLDDVSLDYLPF